MKFINWIREHFAITMMAVVSALATFAAVAISYSSPVVGQAAGLGTVNKFLTALAGVCLWFVFLRLSDAVAGIKFKEAYALLESNASALAVYFGLRALGAGLIIGMLLG